LAGSLGGRYWRRPSDPEEKKGGERRGKLSIADREGEERKRNKGTSLFQLDRRKLHALYRQSMKRGRNPLSGRKREERERVKISPLYMRKAHHN